MASSIVYSAGTVLATPLQTLEWPASKIVHGLMPPSSRLPGVQRCREGHAARHAGGSLVPAAGTYLRRMAPLRLEPRQCRPRQLTSLLRRRLSLKLVVPEQSRNTRVGCLHPDQVGSLVARQRRRHFEH